MSHHHQGLSLHLMVCTHVTSASPRADDTPWKDCPCCTCTVSTCTVGRPCSEPEPSFVATSFCESLYSTKTAHTGQRRTIHPSFARKGKWGVRPRSCGAFLTRRRQASQPLGGREVCHARLREHARGDNNAQQPAASGSSKTRWHHLHHHRGALVLVLGAGVPAGGLLGRVAR